MRAILYRDYGGPEVLEAADRPDPEPGPGEILIRVAAAGVNPIEARLRSGEMKLVLPGGFPRVPGYDVAGTVAAAGENTDFAAGDRVLAFLDNVYGGGYAEFAVCSADAAAKIPAALLFPEAAGLPLAGSTALQALRDHGALKPGETVLVNGAAGGVGAFAVQIAAALGGRVTGVASGDDEEFVRGLGAGDFLDYTERSFADAGRTWDVVFDAAGKSGYGDARSVLAEGGRYVSTEIDAGGLAATALTWPLSRTGKVFLARPRRDDLRELIALYERGALKVEVARRFPLAEAAEAHRALEEDSFRGKLVLEV